MKTPPMLLFATLLFWGWESNLWWAGALAGALLELSRYVSTRWDLEDVDFNRIWSLCSLVAIALFAYLFTADPEGGGLNGMTRGPLALHNATMSFAASANAVLRWLPLVSFPFVVAQVYNVRPTVPLTAVSFALRLRRRRGEQSLAGRYVDLTYPYFMVCLVSAGIHANRGTLFYTYSYFFGVAALILWALWVRRSGRFGMGVWVGGLAVVIVLGGSGLVGIGTLEGIVQRFDAQWIARLLRSRTDPSQSTTSIGDLGELKLSRRIVVRLEPDRLGVAPSYLREATYRSYSPHNETWLAGGMAKNFMTVQPESDNSTWILLPAKTGNASVNVTCYLDGMSEGVPQGVLPLPSGTCRIGNLPAPVDVLETNETGVVRATGTGLMIFKARYGPGATIDSPPSVGTNRLDLYVPTNDMAAINKVIAEMNITSTNDLDKRLAIEQFFTRNFTYSKWQGTDKRASVGATPLTPFLLTSRSGHCEYFATATVLLLRKLGIPARYAVGYYVHEPAGSGYVVRERDAHAWCLVWNARTKAWEDFDTTPASWVSVEGNHEAFLDALSDLRSWLVLQFERVRWGQANLRQYVLWTLSPVLVVLLYYIFFQRRTKARSNEKKEVEVPRIWPGHDSAFYRLEKSLAARGLPRQPQEALTDWLERVLEEPSLADLGVPLRELVQLHYRYRFDPQGLNEAEQKTFVRNVEIVLDRLARLQSEHQVSTVR